MKSKFTLFRLFLTLLITMTCSTQVALAQLYSSGNNTITGNKVGIGTSSPSETLTIKPPTYTQPVYGAKGLNPFKVFYYHNPIAPPGILLPPPTYKTAFFIKWDGKVGVGTASPLDRLHIKGGAISLDNGNRWQIHGTQNAFAVKNTTENRYDFWINKSNGFVGIGATSPQQKLDVRGNAVIEGDLIIKGSNNNTPGTTEIKLQSNGYIRAREIKVDLDAIPDYVFKKDYNLMPLPKLKEFIEKHQHLPNVKSEKEFIEEGSYGLGEMNVKLLEKVEELTLYILQLEERISKLESKGGAK